MDRLEQLYPLSNTIIAEELLKPTAAEERFPKSDIRHWQHSVFRRRYPYKKDKRQVGHYSVQLTFQHRRVEFALGTANKAAAAAHAKEIYQFLRGNGWDATIAKFKPAFQVEDDSVISTVGEFVQAVQATSSAHGRTLPEYIRCFRRIVAGAFGIDDRKKTDYRKTGRARWLERVHAVELSKVTPQRIQAWKVKFLARAGQSPTSQRTARVSVNSALRGARSLFSARRLKFINLAPGFVSPFASVPLEPRVSMRYHSQFDIEAVVRDALVELTGSDPEALKVVMLAALCGLRRAEIDRLTWDAFDCTKRTLHIGPTEHFKPKSEDSIGAVDLESEVAELFRRFKEKASGPFVIESKITPKANASYAAYRCQAVFERVTHWLAKHGVRGQKPLHLLRKEFGSRICDRHGIYIASRMLRHADVATTAAHYLDKKAAATVGLGHLLKVSRP